MTPYEIAAHIRLHPRATLMSGTLAIRFKNGRTLRGTTPFHLITGNPEVDYHANGRAEARPCASGIEILINEEDNQLATLAGHRRMIGFGQVSFGTSNFAASQAQYACLREAGAILDRLTSEGTYVHVAAYPALFPVQMGATQGVYIVIGVFSRTGEPFWLHPDAIAIQALHAPWPERQKIRSLTDNAAASHDTLVLSIRRGLETAGLTGKELRNALTNALRPQLGDDTDAAVAASFGETTPAAAEAPAATVRSSVNSGLARLRKAGKKG